VKSVVLVSVKYIDGDFADLHPNWHLGGAKAKATLELFPPWRLGIRRADSCRCKKPYVGCARDWLHFFVGFHLDAFA
jgi:hypothetical protein